MKNLKIILALYAFLHSGFTVPVRPITASATIGAVSVMAGINVNRSYRKRTAAIRHADNLNPEYIQEKRRERLLYTGGATLLGLGVSAAIGIPLFRHLPAARMERARKAYDFLKIHSLDLSPRYRFSVLREHQEEVYKAILDFGKDNYQAEAQEAYELLEQLKSAAHEDVEEQRVRRMNREIITSALPFVQNPYDAEAFHVFRMRELGTKRFERSSRRNSRSL